MKWGTSKATDKTVMPFGKYKGIELGDILVDDPEYILWLSDETDFSIDKDLIDEAVTRAAKRFRKGYVSSMYDLLDDDEYQKNDLYGMGDW